MRGECYSGDYSLVYGLVKMDVSKDVNLSGPGGGLVLSQLLKVFKRAVLMLLEKCYDNKIVYVTF